MSKLFDIFGLGTGKKFYTRDFKNAYHFRPDVNPVRQKFQGYVNFIFNRESLVFNSLYGQDGSKELRTTLSTLVRTADLPAVAFRTETKNAYNRKKIINYGVDYAPVNMTVYDTVGNEWLTTLMKYFSYHYMDPRNESKNGREISGDQSRIGGAETAGADTFMAQDTWNSNKAGYNTNVTANFFERIDYVLYHANRGVQYSIINPVLTQFKPGSIDYSDSGFMDFEMSFEYERFTTHNVTNFGLSAEDVDRFENASAITGPAFDEAELPLSMQVPDPATESSGAELNFLGETPSRANPSVRSAQPVQAQTGTTIPQVETGNGAVSPTDPVYGGPVAFGSDGGDDGSFGFGDLLGDVADSALTALIHGADVKEAVVGSVVGSTLTLIRQEQEGGGEGEGGE